MQNFRTVEALAKRLSADPALEKQLREDPQATLTAVAAGARDSDVWIYRVVVGALGLVSVLSLIGLFALSFVDREVPDGAVALGSAAIGALAGLLAPSPRQE